jgi:hypothetical protein
VETQHVANDDAEAPEAQEVVQAQHALLTHAPVNMRSAKCISYAAGIPSTLANLLCSVMDLNIEMPQASTQHCTMPRSP